MPDTYTTNQGDTWDSISLSQLGSEKYCSELMAANPDYRDTIFFSAGVVLTLPEIKTTAKKLPKPPWQTQ